MAEEIGEGKLREALKLLDQEEKEIGLRKTAIAAYINTRAANRSLEKEKAALQADIAVLKTAIRGATEAHLAKVEAMQNDFAALKAEHDRIHATAREADQKELNGLKASIGKAKKQAIDAERDSRERLDAADKSLLDATAAAKQKLDALAILEREAEARVSTLNESFRDLLRQHGLAANA